MAAGGFKAIREAYEPKPEHLSFLTDFMHRGAPLDSGAVDLLLQKEVITEEIAGQLRDVKVEKAKAVNALDRYVLTIDQYLERCLKAGYYQAWASKDIQQDDWKTESPGMFPPEYVSFIMSHATRFCDLIAYEPFFLYIEQAKRWMEDEDVDTSSMDFHARVAYWSKEQDRCRQNTYYAIEKYGWYKEASLPNGEGKFVCNLAHVFILYLLDDGRSAYIGKPRQIASTTLLMLAAAFKTSLKKNHFVKLIACDLSTTEEIFEDKFKYGYGRLPGGMRAKVINDSDSDFRVTFNSAAGKGAKKVITSKFGIVAPKESAINGGAPPIVFVDEAPFLSIFSGMVAEAWPTMLTTDIHGNLTLKRQLFAWGTGGRSAKGGGDFEREHRALFEAWFNGNYSMGIVPVFLDWTCRPNITEKIYTEQRLRYTSTTTASEQDQHEKLIMFRQHYPSTLDDMYSVSDVTLVPASYIIKNQDKINTVAHHLRPVRGKFLLNYDLSKESPAGSQLKHPVLSVEFVRGEDHDMSLPVEMFIDRKPTWKYRMYQGTDPIEADEGKSKHASSIWDELFYTIACTVNMRTNDPYDSYIQSIAMGMYYANHGEKYCPELAENNVAKLYVEWKSGHEWLGSSSLTFNKQLPSFLQGGGTLIGFNNKQARKSHLKDIGKEMTMSHGRNIYHPTYWSQLRHFVPTVTKSGNITWAVDDYKKQNDDILIASWLAYVNRMAHAHRMPVDMSASATANAAPTRQKYKYVFDRATRTTRLVEVTQRKTNGKVQTPSEGER